MKKYLLLFKVRTISVILVSICLMVVFIPINAHGQKSINFEDYFLDQTLRVDYEHLGDAELELIVLDRMYQKGLWAGSKINLIDTFNFGYFRYSITDALSGKLLFSKDFNSNYGEYKVTPPAQDGVKKAFHESALLPMPKKEVVFKIEKRNKTNEFEILFTLNIEPDSRQIIREESGDPDVMIFTALYNGDSHKKVDVLYVAEGYEANEIFKFEQDLKRFSENLFEKEPLKSNKKNFNVWGAFKASAESGVDQPRHGSFRKTNVGASFNSFDIERYLLINDNKSLRDIAGHAPYDAVFILVNHERYGGAGMYNLYCTLTTDNSYSNFLMIHEFGHSFFGLADEYYTSEVGFEDIYGEDYEPIEANITALKDSVSLKWRHLVKDNTPVPTPWEKEKYDNADESWQVERRELKENIARLVRENVSEAEIEVAELLFREKDQAHAKKMYDWLHSGPYAEKVGAFEGAGYISEGMYRPMKDCIMFSKKAEEFCPVCQETMQKIIDWYSK